MTIGLPHADPLLLAMMASVAPALLRSGVKDEEVPARALALSKALALEVTRETPMFHAHAVVGAMFERARAEVGVDEGPLFTRVAPFGDDGPALTVMITSLGVEELVERVRAVMPEAVEKSEVLH